MHTLKNIEKLRIYSRVLIILTVRVLFYKSFTLVVLPIAVNYILDKQLLHYISYDHKTVVTENMKTADFPLTMNTNPKIL